VKRGVQASLHTYDGSGRKEELAVAESADDVAAVIAELEDDMQVAANKLEFERAALLRDQINALKSGDYKTVGAKPAPYGRKNKTPAKAGVGTTAKKSRL
jgi:excinuclease ABC subunit B